jgi:transcription termination factor NusB
VHSASVAFQEAIEILEKFSASDAMRFFEMILEIRREMKNRENSKKFV